ncbi:hypothetical protein N7G274_007972 [Stereocaulon virgatum]|uniref:Uncharacterized protein n=1 Tax=Stereocaulon virgatum TaxID=373712 RepID=A0ABR4A3L1_9LECA
MPNPFKPAMSQPLYSSGTPSPPEEYENVASDPLYNAALSQTGEMARRTLTQNKEKWVGTVSSSKSTSSSPRTQATTSVTSSSITSTGYPSPSKLNPGAPTFRPSSYGTQPHSEIANQNTHQAASSESNLNAQALPPIKTSVLTLPPNPFRLLQPIPPQNRTLGWPPSQPPLTKKAYNTQHPNSIPDAVFLTDHAAGTSWRYLHNVYENDKFNPANTPWWTHWFIAFAHVYTRTHSAAEHGPGGENEVGGQNEGEREVGWTSHEICAAYRFRYGYNVPGLERMTVEDEDALFAWLVFEKMDYAFEWEGKREAELIGEIRRCVEAVAGVKGKEGEAMGKDG